MTQRMHDISLFYYIDTRNVDDLWDNCESVVSIRFGN